MKRILPVLLAAALLFLAACGGSAPAPSVVPESTQPESAPPSPLPSAAPEPESPDAVTIEIKNESDQRTVKGVQVATISFDYPIVSVTGEATPAAEALSAWADSFYQQSLDWAQDLMNEAETLYTESPEYFMESYYYTQTLEPVYESAELTVLLCSTESYMGGNHSMHNQSAVNLDLESGTPLTLEDIGDPKAIVAGAEQEILRQISQQGLVPELYENYADFVAEGIVDSAWYLTEEGFAVIYNEYYLAPYASGRFVFTVPYALLEGSLDPEYMLK